jgi:hypothetical protein
MDPGPSRVDRQANHENEGEARLDAEDLVSLGRHGDARGAEQPEQAQDEAEREVRASVIGSLAGGSAGKLAEVIHAFSMAVPRSRSRQGVGAADQAFV